MHKIKTGEKEESYDCPLCFIKNVVLVFFYPWQNIINSSVSRESLSQLLLIRSKWNSKHWETPGRRSQLRLFFSLFQKYSQSVPSCLCVTQFSQEEVSDKGNPSLFIPNSMGGKREGARTAAAAVSQEINVSLKGTSTASTSVVAVSQMLDGPLKGQFL